MSLPLLVSKSGEQLGPPASPQSLLSLVNSSATDKFNNISDNNSAGRDKNGSSSARRETEGDCADELLCFEDAQEELEEEVEEEGDGLPAFAS